jgi:predicted nucleic acid-binding protein
MCIIIDTNTFSNVFDKESKGHHEFQPVYDWILNRNGKIVFGGTKYRLELKKAYRFLKIFGEFNRQRKLVTVDDVKIDEYQRILENKKKHKDFDDPHLVAISYISKCKLICTNERRAIPYLTCKDFYPKNSPRPKIYCKKKNSDLLCDKYLADLCKPCVKLDKKTAKKLDITTSLITKK